MMDIPPKNEHALELALNDLAGSNFRAVEYRDMMAGVILGQMLPDGCVVKGGTSLRLRFGPSRSRVTMDFDAARRDDFELFLDQLRERTARGWSGFTGDVLIRRPGSPRGVPFDYVMQPLDVKLAYGHHPWCTIRLEVSHNELGDADETELCPIPSEIASIFAALGFPSPKPIALMPIEFQIAQKLHGVTATGNTRARDLIDLQLLATDDLSVLRRTAAVCTRLFRYRKMQPWPTHVAPTESWTQLYDDQKGNLPVLQTLVEAVDWTNALIDRLAAL